MGFGSRERDMKICLISSVDMNRVDGSTVRPLSISELLVEFGCEIMHICFEPPPEQRKIISYAMKYNKGSSRIMKLINILKWYKQVKRFRPDVIYAHQIFNATIAIPLKYILRRPLVYDEHCSFALDSHSNKRDILWEKMVSKIADKVIVVSGEVNEIFTERYGMPEEKIKTIKNGVNTDLFKPMEKDNKLKEKLGISDTDKVIVFICPRTTPANFVALEYFFNLVPEIEGRIRDVKFIIIGGGPQPDSSSPNIIYTGLVQDLTSYINLGDACISPYPPSARIGTGCPKNKIIEYFACGKPVISTEEGITGFDDAVPNRDFLRASDSDDFVEKLVTVLYDENLSKKLGENARKLSLKYDWSSLSKKVFKTLESVINVYDKKRI
jgi:glycosyltransferase involved in cell wall biosynthesis